LTLPVGPYAQDLTEDPTGIQAQVYNGWSVTQNGAIFSFTPNSSKDGEIDRNGILFVLSSVSTNDQYGTCSIKIDETASAPTQSSADRTTEIGLTKCPTTFSLSDLVVNPPEINAGGSATIEWSGSPADYTLSYNPDGKGLRTFSVNNVESYVAKNLSNSPTVYFTLDVKLVVEGQDQPLKIQKHSAVRVLRPKPEITLFRGEIFSDDPNVIQLELNWATKNASRVTISEIPDQLDPDGGSKIILPTLRKPLQSSYTLTARNADDFSISSQITIEWGTIYSNTELALQHFAICTLPRNPNIVIFTRSETLFCGLSADLYNSKTLQPNGKFLLLDPQSEAPRGVAISPDGSQFCVTYNNNMFTKKESVALLSMFSARTFHKIGELQLKRFGTAPAFSGDGKYIFSGSTPRVVGDDYDQVLVVDAKTLQVVGQPIQIQWDISHIAASLDNYIFVVSMKWRRLPPDDPFPPFPSFPKDEPTNDPAVLSVIDTRTFQVVGEPITLGVEPTDIAISPDGARVFVCNKLSKTISVIDASNLQRIVQLISLQAWPECLSVSLDGLYLFVGMYYRSSGRENRIIQVFETDTLHKVNQIGPIDGLYDYGTIEHIATSLDNASVIALSFKEAWVVIPSSVTAGVGLLSTSL